MAQVYEKYPGKWYLRFYRDGKRVNRVVATTKSEAMAALIEFIKRKTLDDLDLPDLPKKNSVKIKFEDLARQYLDHSAADKSPQTYKSELERINSHWLPLFKGKYISEITPIQIQKWKENRHAKGIRSHTIHTELKILKTMFSRAKDWGLFSGSDPVGKLPKTVRRQIKFLKSDEAERYLAACAPGFLPLAAVLIFTGMRKGELFELKWDDLDFQNSVIVIRPESSLKNEEGRMIPMNSQLIPILEKLPRTSVYVFPGEDGTSQRKTCQHAHTKARKKANLPDLDIHHLRHTFASLCIQEGYDIGAVSKLLGHGSLRITMDIYHHLNPDHARKVVEGIPVKVPVQDNS